MLIDGLEVSSSTNTFSNAINGLTLTATATTATAFQVTVANNQTTAKENIDAFVAAFNKISTSLADLTKYDVTNSKSSTLQGDSAALGLQNTLKRIVTGAGTGSSSFARLSDIGVELQRDGTLKVKAGARPIKKPNDPTAAGVNLPDVNAQQMIAKRRAAAQVTAGTFIQVGMAVFGDEWKPDVSREFNEVEFLTQATDDYYAATGFKELPPWAALAVAYGSYAVKRLNRPVTQSKIKGWFQAAKDKLILWWVNRGKKAVNNGARPDLGNNSKRKDNVSVQVGGDVPRQGNADTRS
jgi:hypothetical protein